MRSCRSVAGELSGGGGVSTKRRAIEVDQGAEAALWRMKMRISGDGYRAWTLLDRPLPVNVDDPDPDIYVQLEGSSDMYVATFYTADRLKYIMELLPRGPVLEKGTLYSKSNYFADESMVIVCSMDEANIAEAIEGMIANGRLQRIFELSRRADED